MPEARSPVGERASEGCQPTFVQTWHPWVLKTLSVFLMVTTPCPVRLSLAMIESKPPLLSLPRSQ
ncbi:hypothetical protein ASE03_28550 [Kitasatospora sp. Root187]|nr:hypothetical protein ASC99_21055 [Kitasatospora sp. Root107]KRB69118.1 hypothetical protein ASE03_28550 [Kitasatospora sp. Root187]